MYECIYKDSFGKIKFFWEKGFRAVNFIAVLLVNIVVNYGTAHTLTRSLVIIQRSQDCGWLRRWTPIRVQRL